VTRTARAPLTLDDDVVEAIASVVQLILERNGIAPQPVSPAVETHARALGATEHCEFEQLMDIDEVAQWLRKPSRSSIYELCRSRSRDPLPSIRCGRRLLFATRSVAAWLDRQRTERSKQSSAG